MPRRDLSDLSIRLNVSSGWLERLLAENREAVEAYFARMDRKKSGPPLNADGSFKEIRGVPTPVTFDKRTK